MSDSPTVELLEKHRKEREGKEDKPAYSLTRDSRQSITLDLHFRNGKRKSRGYHHLMDIDLESPAEMMLRFTHMTITLTGRNLLPLYKALSDHRVRTITETGEEQDNLPEEETVIYKIAVGEE